MTVSKEFLITKAIKMERISDVVLEGNLLTFDFATDSYREAMLLRRSLLLRVASYGVDIVEIFTNTSSMPSETIAHRLGLLVVDNSLLCIPEGGPIPKLKLDVQGPRMVTTRDIEQQQLFTGNGVIELLWLHKGQQLDCRLHLVKNKGITHAKWCAVVAPRYVKTDAGFHFTCELTGQLGVEEILQQAVANTLDISEEERLNVFTRI